MNKTALSFRQTGAETYDLCVICRLSCLEDLVPHFLAFLSSSSKDGPEHLTVDVVESFDVPMGNFIALVGRPDNIGILGDRALLVKRYQLPGFERSRSHLLYLLAERFHARLRQRAAAMKWPVQAFPQAIQIEDAGFLEPIEEVERQQRVIMMLIFLLFVRIYKGILRKS